MQQKGIKRFSHLIEVRELELSILQCLLHRDPAPVQQIAADGLELGPAEVGLNVLRAISSSCDEGQRDGCVGHTGELHLGLLCCLC